MEYSGAPRDIRSRSQLSASTAPHARSTRTVRVASLVDNREELILQRRLSRRLVVACACRLATGSGCSACPMRTQDQLLRERDVPKILAIALLQSSENRRWSQWQRKGSCYLVQVAATFVEALQVQNEDVRQPEELSR